MVSRLLFFTLQLTTILSIASSSCINEPFSFCGIGYLKYPFWGGSRGPHCGHQGFHITCDTSSSGGAGVPILNISSLPYKLSSLDFSTNTLRVVRQDFQFQNEACPNQLLRNTTLDIRFFEFPTNSTDRNLTLFLDCRGDGVESLPNKFKCNSTINLFTIAEASAGPGAGVSCRSSIFIPVNEKDAVSLEDPSASSVNILRSALAAGFSIQWLNQSIDPPPRHAPGYPPVQSPGKAPPRFSETLKPGNGRKKWRSPAKVIDLVVEITGIGVIILIIVLALNRRQANTPNPESKKEVENFLLKHGSITPKRFRYSEIKKMTKSFSDKLGQGGYGSVYKGMLPDGSPVAVKILFQTDSNGEEFVNEVASISRTSHVNIVTLLGFCYEGSKRALVYEFMPNNSLDKFLNQSLETMDRCLSLEQLYKIAVGTAKGLEYLHTGCTTRIVHFDIKPQNILLDEEFTPKISDFGLAKLCKKKQSILSSMLGTRGTVGYIAPEVFSRNFGGVSHKSDVYSYGMMLLEMVGARKVTEAEANQSSENYFPDRIYEEVITEVVIEEGEEEERRKMILIGFWCIQTMSSSRPSMSKVVEMLEGSVSSIQIPPKPFLFSPNRSSHQVSSTLSAYVETQDSAEY